MIVEIRHDNCAFTLLLNGTVETAAEVNLRKLVKCEPSEIESLPIGIIEVLVLVIHTITFLHEDGNGHVDLLPFRRKLKKVASSRWETGLR
jgi:hypothetical protein